MLQLEGAPKMMLLIQQGVDTSEAFMKGLEDGSAYADNKIGWDASIRECSEVLRAGAEEMVKYGAWRNR